MGNHRLAGAFLLGATLGTALDAIHVYGDVETYPNEVFGRLGWFVPLEFGLAGVAVAIAIPVLERAAAAGLALAHTNLGICHFHAGDSRRALEHFAAAAEQLPDDATAQQNYARARAAAPLPSS